ncbi:MAG: hypothetical protein Q9N34_03975 [Aquificota bacterium]|nr:hypothetical protein [Aquificota bacterium]
MRVHINRGGVDRVLKVGYSIRVNSEERFIEIYREDSVLTQGGSSSRGKFRKVRYTGTPTIRGVYVLLGVEAVGLGGKTAVPLVRLREIDEKGERLTEYLFLPRAESLCSLNLWRHRAYPQDEAREFPLRVSRHHGGDLECGGGPQAVVS